MPRNQSLTIQIPDLITNESGYCSTKTNIISDTSFHREPLDDKFWAMKLFNRFRKILVRLLFSSTTPSSYRDGGGGRNQGRRHSDDRHSSAEDPPKISCSSSSVYNYSTQLHYSEAVADCIEFLNKSSSASSTPATTTHDVDDEDVVRYSGFDQHRLNQIGHVWV